MATPETSLTKTLVQRLRDLRVKLKSGEYDGADLMEAWCAMAQAADELEQLRAAFKNFHRLLCERFGYGHDDIDWERDQLSLIEWIAKRAAHEPGDALGAQIYALLVRRGYAQHEAHLIASGPGCISDCVQKGYPDIDCPEHGPALKSASAQ